MVNANFSVVRKTYQPNTSHKFSKDVKFTFVFSCLQFWYKMSRFVQLDLKAHAKFDLTNEAQIFQMYSLLFPYLNRFGITLIFI